MDQDNSTKGEVNTGGDAGALSQMDRDDIREAVLNAARSGHYTSGMAEALIADLKAIKTAS